MNIKSFLLFVTSILGLTTKVAFAGESKVRISSLNDDVLKSTRKILAERGVETTLPVIKTVGASILADINANDPEMRSILKQIDQEFGNAVYLESISVETMSFGTQDDIVKP